MNSLQSTSPMIVFCYLLPLVAVAQSQPPSTERATRLFTRWDKNRDSRLAPSELPDNARRNFQRVDGNQDGFISLNEHVSFLTKNRDSSQPRRKRRELAGITIRRNIPYAETDNPRQTLDLFLPRKRNAHHPLPVILWIHGGAWRGGSKASGGDRISSFVRTGQYAGASIGYRLSDEARWPAQIHDCKAAIRWIRANASTYQLDGNKIAVYGSSAGGHLSAMLGVSENHPLLEGKLGNHTDQASRVTCVIDFFGPTSFLKMDERPGKIVHNAPDSPESQLVGAPIQRVPEKSRQASPLTHVGPDDAPHLIVHGTHDQLVPFHQSTIYHAALRRAGIASTLITIQEGGHGVRGSVLDERIARFLGHYLYRRDTVLKDEVLDIDSLRRKR